MTSYFFQFVDNLLNLNLVTFFIYETDKICLSAFFSGPSYALAAGSYYSYCYSCSEPSFEFQWL